MEPAEKKTFAALGGRCKSLIISGKGGLFCRTDALYRTKRCRLLPFTHLSYGVRGKMSSPFWTKSAAPAAADGDGLSRRQAVSRSAFSASRHSKRAPHKPPWFHPPRTKRRLTGAGFPAVLPRTVYPARSSAISSFRASTPTFTAALVSSPPHSASPCGDPSLLSARAK